jgi:ADP-ribose pyrophosphatase YjhB (NUDIX family)
MGTRASHELSCSVIVEYPRGSGKIVLVGEPEKGHSLNFPGGGVDLLKYRVKQSETLVVAAEREAVEESGLIVELGRIIGLNHNTRERKMYHTIAATAIGGSLSPSIKHPIVRAFSLDQIIELNADHRLRSPRVEHWATEYFNPPTEPITLDQQLIEFDSDPYPQNLNFDYVDQY